MLGEPAFVHVARRLTCLGSVILLLALIATHFAAHFLAGAGQ